MYHGIAGYASRTVIPGFTVQVREYPQGAAAHQGFPDWESSV